MDQHVKFRTELKFLGHVENVSNVVMSGNRLNMQNEAEISDCTDRAEIYMVTASARARTIISKEYSIKNPVKSEQFSRFG